MMKVWLISGLGADERAFRNLDFTGFEPHYVHWVKPEMKDSIADYAKKLSVQITEDNPMVIGYSLGGMLAVELSKQRPLSKIILLASSTTRKEMPAYFRWAGHIPVSHLVPVGLVKKVAVFRKYFFNLKDHQSDAILNPMIKDADPFFLRWGAKAVTRWQNMVYPQNLIHIHGTADRILPFLNVHADIVINHGSHLFPINRSEETSKWLQALLSADDLEKFKHSTD